MIPLRDAGFRFGAIALLGLIALQIFRQSRSRMPAVIAVAFTVTLSAYLICSAPFWNDLSGWLQAFLRIGCLANPVLFWLLARSIFDDGFRLSWAHALLPIAIEVIGFWYVFGLHKSDLGNALQPLIAKAVGGSLQTNSIALVIVALVIAYRGRAPDLVESRRNFRTHFVAVTGGYMIMVIVIEVFLRGAAPHPIASAIHAAAIFAIVFYFATSLLALTISLLFEPIHTPTTALELDVPERAMLEQLDAAITKQTFLQTA